MPQAASTSSGTAAELRAAYLLLRYLLGRGRWPGDLVFYPEDSHVGIVGGRDESGNLLIIHCASGYNNVVITGIEGFTSIGRPVYFSD